MRAKTVCSWGFYWAGDLVSRATYGFDWQWGHDLYQWLMQRSLDLDLEEAIWGTDEECEE